MIYIESDEMVEIEKQNAIVNIIYLMRTFDINLDDIHRQWTSEPINCIDYSNFVANNIDVAKQS